MRARLLVLIVMSMLLGGWFMIRHHGRDPMAARSIQICFTPRE